MRASVILLNSACARRSSAISAALAFEEKLHAHRFGHDEDVAEEDGRVDAEDVDRLQRYFRRQIGRLAELEEADLLADGAVLRQAAPGLPHQPDRRLVDASLKAG